MKLSQDEHFALAGAVVGAVVGYTAAGSACNHQEIFGGLVNLIRDYPITSKIISSTVTSIFTAKMFYSISKGYDY